MSDSELLRRFVAEGDKDAFDEVARRHTAMVYSTCLRRLGDPSDAEDAVQAVFIALAEKATTIRNGDALPGWLYRMAGFAASHVSRERARRKRREREAAQMRAASHADGEDIERAWRSVRPELDASIDRLPARYRDAVVLHHFSGLSREETARRLGISTEALAMRLSRATAKLRSRLARRGVTVASAALGAMLASQVVEAVPAAVAGAVAAAAAGGGPASAGAGAIAKGAMTMMMWTKVKVVAAFVAAVVVAGVAAPVAYMAVAADGEAPEAKAGPGKPGTSGRPSAMIRFKRGEHPRIWITRADLPEIRRRCAPGGSHEREFKRLKELVDAGGWGVDHINTAFLYLVTGERKYAETAKKKLMAGGVNKQAGVALDWIMTKCAPDKATGVPVTRDELKTLVKKITSNRHSFEFYRKVPGENPFLSPWRYKVPGVLYMGLVMHGEGLDEDRFDRAFDCAMGWVKDVWIPATNRHARGVYYPGFDYYRYSNGAEARWAEAWKVASGEDLFAGSVQLREFVRHAFYQRDPRTGVWVHYEQGRSGTSVANVMPIYSHANPDLTVRGIAQYMENRRIDDSFWKKTLRDWNTKSKSPGLWERILWYDPEAKEMDPKSIPTAAYWPGNGYSSFRSGWGPDDTTLYFVAGDHVSEHQRLYQGHFGIYRKGMLATTSGSYDSCAKPDAAYFTRTIANNCLLVRDPDEIFWDGYGKLHSQPNNGGQYMFGVGAIAWGGNWRNRKKDDIWDVADTVAFDSKEFYGYVAGDMTNAYRREVKDPVMKDYGPDRITFTPKQAKNKLTRCTRQIVYLKPDLFIMYDRVDSTNPEFTKTWLLHTMNEPTIDGNETRKLPDEGAVEYDGSIYSAEHGEGKLIVRRLLPEKAVARKRGGKDFYAWADGKHWPKGNKQVYGWEYSAMWRIEEEPSEERADDEFLHVLYACDKGTPAARMPKAELVTNGGLTGVKIDYLGRTYEVMFEKGGGRKCAGRIKVTARGRTLVDEALAGEVRPTFEVKNGLE